MSTFENYGKAEEFSTATCLSLYDRIPEWRLPKIDWYTNNEGMSPEVLRNSIEITSEKPDKIKRLGELLTVLANETAFSDDVEKNEIPEKIKELLTLVRI